MSSAWSIYIIALTIANILGCVWLLWWTARRRPGDRSESGTTGHVWDGDITELEKPMPRWWLNLFYASVVFGVAYLVLYPGLGAYAGLRAWTSEAELAAQRAEAERKLQPLFARFAGKPVAELSHDEHALELGGAIFANHCAMCHGSDAKGAVGFPNLTDRDWLWGGDPEQVLATILNGRQATMPPLGQVLGDLGVTQAASYVQSLSGTAVDPTFARGGEVHFKSLCAACHGADGKGNQALGAPDLTDRTWLYGSSYKAVVTTIRDGRNGRMPAHKPILGEDRARLVAAWVLAQGAANAAPASSVAGTP